MDSELFLLGKKHSDMLIEQTKTERQEKLEYKLNMQMEKFFLSPPVNLVEERKWLLTEISFEASNSVFNITHEKNTFSKTIPGHWSSRGGAETINTLQKLLQLRHQNDIELHVQEVQKRGNQIEIGDKEYKKSDFDTHTNEII